MRVYELLLSGETTTFPYRHLALFVNVNVKSRVDFIRLMCLEKLLYWSGPKSRLYQGKTFELSFSDYALTRCLSS